MAKVKKGEVRAVINPLLNLQIENEMVKASKKKCEIVRMLLEKGLENKSKEDIEEVMMNISNQLDDIREGLSKLLKENIYTNYQILYVLCSYIEEDIQDGKIANIIAKANVKANEKIEKLGV